MKLGVVTIFFYWLGGGGGITKSLPGVYYLKLDINLIVHIGRSPAENTIKSAPASGRGHNL